MWLSGATGAQRGPRRSDSLFSLSVWKGSTKLAAEEQSGPVCRARLKVLEHQIQGC